jgi:hypothetical protein
VLCCTAEVLANIALREGEGADVDDVVMDEFHWYADRDRGVAWQVPLLTLKQARFLLMSATLGDVTFFAEQLTRLNGRPTATIKSAERPVPLEYAYSEIPLPQMLEKLVAEDKAPVYVVCFTQKDAADSAQDFTSLNLCSREEKNAVAQAIEGFRFTSPYGPDVRKWLKQGIGVHHAGLLPKYRVLVEQLTQRGLLKVICGTDTLGVGINVPIRTVLFSRLCKFDGEKTAVLSARDFHQIAGPRRAQGLRRQGLRGGAGPGALHREQEARREGEGRQEGGQAQAARAQLRELGPADVQAAHGRPARAADLAIRRVARDAAERALAQGRRPQGDAVADPRQPRDGAQKKAHFKRGWQLFRALVERGIVEITPRSEEGSRLRVNVDLQEDFSMDQALSLYLFETLALLDPESETHALDLLSLVESILENPELILRKQLDKLKDEKVAEMKAEGKDYDQRMAELEKMEHPKPLREFTYMTFNAFAERHPWVGEQNIRPKSIAREMFEGFRSFSDYVQEYDLERAEGLLLRHLHSVYKVLTPDRAGHGEERQRARDRAVPPGHAAPGGLEPARRVGAHARPRLSAVGSRRDGRAPVAARGAAGRHARQQGLHRGDPHAVFAVPARVVDGQRRGRAGGARIAERR